MAKLFKSAVVVGSVLVVGWALSIVGVFDFHLPWGDLADERAVVYREEPAQIVEIEPISLDCSARVHARVPVRATREHSLLGRVYRTDRLDLQAAGDVDTCVDGNSVEWDHTRGRVDVTIPASSIRFVRPRVDLHRVETDFDKGLAGKVTDALPWVDDDEGLTRAALAFAQDTIGGRECMQTAYEVTEQMLVDAYADQLAEQGFESDEVDVAIVGDPDFSQNDPGAEVAADDFELEIVDTGLTCEVALAGSESSDPGSA